MFKKALTPGTPHGGELRQAAGVVAPLLEGPALIWRRRWRVLPPGITLMCQRELFPNLFFIHYRFAASLNCVNDISIAQERVSLIESTFLGLTDSQVPSTVFTAFFLARQNRVPRHVVFSLASCVESWGRLPRRLSIFGSMNELEDRSVG